MAPTDAAGDIRQGRTVLVLVFCKVRLGAIISTHGLPSCLFDDVIQLAVHKQTSTLLCTPATA